MDGGYNQDDSLRDQQTTNAKAKLSDLTKTDLVELIGHLEHEVHSRDSVINEMMSQQTREVLYQSKYGRFGISDPFTALQRDSEKVTNDNFDHNQVKTLFDNQLQQLENLIETQRRAQSTMREQKLSADERYKKVCQQLEEAKMKHARDTAQGDDVTVALEKEREKLQQDLAYTKAHLKKCEKELRKTKAQLDRESQLAVKHKQVALDLIKERRKMVAKVAESEKKNQSIAQLLQKEQEDNKKSENSKLLQLEARMERQLMDFDIEREQYKTRLRKEESKVRDLLLQLTDIKETVLSLQQDSNDTVVENTVGSSSDLTDSSGFTSTSNVTPVSLIKTLTQTVTVSKAPVSTDSRISDLTAIKARTGPKPVFQPHGARQSNVAAGQLRVSQSRQAAPLTSPKPISHNVVISQVDTQVGSASRMANARQETTSRTAAISSSQSVRGLSQSASTKQNATGNKVENSPSIGTPISSRLASRSNVAQTNSPRFTGSQVASALVTGPPTTNLRVTGPQLASPRVTGPQMASPRVTGPQSASPRVTGPQSASPRVTGPQSANPRVTGPQSASPRGTGPSAASPRMAGPQTTSLHMAGPQTISPRMTGTQAPSSRMSGPQTTGPRVTGPQMIGPRVTGSQIVTPQETVSQTASLQPNVPQTASPRVIKLSSSAVPSTRQPNVPLQVSTTNTNNINSKSTVMSPRSVSVPPHLGTSLTIMEPKLAGVSSVSTTNWRNSLSSDSVASADPTNVGNVSPVTVSLISPTDKSTIVASKPKPPPPVRNVSLPSSKKYHSIENTS